MILFDKTTIKTIQIVNLFSSLWYITLFFLRSPHFMFSEKFKIFSFPKKTRTIYQKCVTFCNFWNNGYYINNCFLFLELFSIIYKAHYVCSSVRNVFFRTCLFQNILMTTSHFIIWYLICVFSIFIGSFVILVDIQTGVINNV